MTNLLLWIFMAYGMTSILVWGSIFENAREWIIHKSKFFGDLISCTLCTSTWVGFFMSVVIGSVSAIYFPSFWFVNFFFDGMFTAGSVWALNTIIDFYENRND